MRDSICTAFCLILMFTCALAEPAGQPGERQELPGGISDKPYIHRSGGGIAIGGYMDHEFEAVEGGGNTFDQHRFIPFIYAEVTDRLHVSAEIEFEHGGLIGGGSSSDTDGEIKLEYAVVDFRLSEALQFRSGVILSPLGRFNLLHDSPLNDLTERPTVDLQIIPSTLSESGMGLFGTFYPSDLTVASYELYVVNGFDRGIIDKAGRLRIRGGRGSQKQDNNANKALVGRLGFSPRLGMNVGLSFHRGAYSDEGDQALTVGAVDVGATRGPLEFQGEFAFSRAGIDRSVHPDAAESQRGAYGQVNLHFGHDRFLPESVFTGALRWDWVDFDSDEAGDSESGMTVGLNFRPVEEAVFKLDYNWTWKTPLNEVRGEARGRFFFSVATYF